MNRKGLLGFSRSTEPRKIVSVEHDLFPFHPISLLGNQEQTHPVCRVQPNKLRLPRMRDEFNYEEYTEHL